MNAKKKIYIYESIFCWIVYKLFFNKRWRSEKKILRNFVLNKKLKKCKAYSIGSIPIKCIYIYIYIYIYIRGTSPEGDVLIHWHAFCI